MTTLALKEVHVSGDGKMFLIIAVSEKFANMTRVKKQQTIYRPLIQYISDNRIHSISIKTYSLEEWKRDKTLNGF